jgi:hypothetical protein
MRNPIFALLVTGTLALAGFARAEGDTSSAGALRARYTELQPQLQHNAFGRPLHLEASEGSKELKGDVYGVVQYPFAQVEKAFTEAGNWCDVLILPFNTKYCRASGGESDRTLSVRIGRKADQPAEQAYPIDFKYRVAERSDAHFRTVLKAASGPLGTHDYQIVLEAIPVDDKHAFIHLAYSYGFGIMSKLAMQTYLGTIGASKVGFTVTGSENGKPTYVGGMLGATERNTMRYFLAIEAYLASLAAPEGERVDKRLNDWFAATEKYPRQLHEMDRGEYLAMKQKETKRVGAL